MSRLALAIASSKRDRFRQRPRKIRREPSDNKCSSSRRRRRRGPRQPVIRREHQKPKTRTGSLDPSPLSLSSQNDRASTRALRERQHTARRRCSGLPCAGKGRSPAAEALNPMPTKRPRRMTKQERRRHGRNQLARTSHLTRGKEEEDQVGPMDLYSSIAPRV